MLSEIKPGSLLFFFGITLCICGIFTTIALFKYSFRYKSPLVSFEFRPTISDDNVNQTSTVPKMKAPQENIQSIPPAKGRSIRRS